MARCTGTKRNGDRCEVVVGASKTYCYQHDPARAQERKRNASKGGKSTGGREIKDLKQRISNVIDAVLDGSQDRGRAAVAIQGFNALRGVLELERKVKETEDLEARIDALERSLEQRGGRAWRGA